MMCYFPEIASVKPSLAQIIETALIVRDFVDDDLDDVYTCYSLVVHTPPNQTFLKRNLGLTQPKTCYYRLCHQVHKSAFQTASARGS